MDTRTRSNRGCSNSRGTTRSTGQWSRVATKRCRRAPSEVRSGRGSASLSRRWRTCMCFGWRRGRSEPTSARCRPTALLLSIVKAAVIGAQRQPRQQGRRAARRTPMKTPHVWPMLAAERSAVIDFSSNLSDADWTRGSACSGWSACERARAHRHRGGDPRRSTSYPTWRSPGFLVRRLGARQIRPGRGRPRVVAELRKRVAAKTKSRQGVPRRGLRPRRGHAAGRRCRARLAPGGDHDRGACCQEHRRACARQAARGGLEAAMRRISAGPTAPAPEVSGPLVLLIAKRSAGAASCLRRGSAARSLGS